MPLANDAKATLPTLKESNAVSVEKQKVIKEAIKELARLRAEVWGLKNAKND